RLWLRGEIEDRHFLIERDPGAVPDAAVRERRVDSADAAGDLVHLIAQRHVQAEPDAGRQPDIRLDEHAAARDVDYLHVGAGEDARAKRGQARRGMTRESPPGDGGSRWVGV